MSVSVIPATVKGEEERAVNHIVLGSTHPRKIYQEPPS